MSSEDFDARVQRIAEAHLVACNEALYDNAESSPALGPYCGCQTCVVREVLMSVWDEFLAEARHESRAPASDWFVPGGPVLDDSGQRLRLRPPPGWTRQVIEIPRVPPSMNNNEIRSHWTGFQKEKKSWQAEIALMLMAAQLPRGGYERAIAGAFLRFETRSIRDSGNFTGLLAKALGDALVIGPDWPRRKRYIPDDDESHYHFGGVEFESESGPPRTTVYLYLQPKEQ